MRSKAKLAGMLGRRPALIVRRMPDRMHSHRQLSEEEYGNEKELAQRIHDVILMSAFGSMVLIDLDEQTFEIFTFGKVQGDRMVGGACKSADNARRAAGIHRRPGNDLLE